MTKLFNYSLILLILFSNNFFAQSWEEISSIFNPSGVPSLSFSQPRFYDLDSDGDFDLILGNTAKQPLYFVNTGSNTNPKFELDEFVFSQVNPLDAEVGVCVDFDNDGDLDFISGGFTGLHYYENIGDSSDAYFEKADNPFTNISVGNFPVPTLGDLDGDGDLDLVVGLSENGAVKFIPNSGDINTPQFLESNASIWLDAGLFAYPLLYDFNKDNLLDLIVGKDGYGFIYYENSGDSTSYAWTDKSSMFQNLGRDTYWNSPSLVDLTGDGKNDILFGTANGHIKFFQNSGSNDAPTWSENTSLFGGTIDIGGQSSPILFDFDSDGDLDLISGSQMGDLKYLENIGTISAPAWHENSSIFTSIDHSIYSAVAVGDLDNDGIVEIIVGDLSGKLYLHKKSGSSYPLVANSLDEFAFGGFSVPRLVDFDFDSDLDLIVGNDLGQLAYLENVGTPDSASWSEITNFFGFIDVGSNCVPYPIDYDNDGDYDLVIGNLSGDLVYYENENNVFTSISSVFEGISVSQNASPALGDLDNDGDADLIIGNYGGTFKYFRNTNPVSVENEKLVQPESFNISQNYPNPFNPTTVINYSIAKSDNVTIIVYNSLGMEVTTLVNRFKSAGNYQVEFNASSLASGIYFYKIVSGNNLDIKKMLLLK